VEHIEQAERPTSICEDSICAETCCRETPAKSPDVRSTSRPPLMDSTSGCWISPISAPKAPHSAPRAPIGSQAVG